MQMQHQITGVQNVKQSTGRTHISGYRARILLWRPYLQTKRCSIPLVVLREYLHIADYMIAYDAKAADVERVGSHMQLIKTKLRTRLADLTFKALLFLSFNLPLLHDIDIDLLVEAWKAAGHRCQ